MALPDRARHDVNLKPTLIAVSNADGETPVTLQADPTTHQLLVSGTGGGGGGDGAILDGVSSAIKATVFDLINSNPLATQIVDASGTAITSFGGGSQYAEDVPHLSGDLGNLMLSVRSDSAASTAGTNGDYAGLITDNTGRLWVNIGAITASSQPLPTGAATSANQTTMQTTLSSIDTKIIGDANSIYVGGNVAAGSADAGFPVKVGGRYNSTKPTYTDGQRGDLQIGSRGSLAVTLFSADTATSFSARTDNADAVGASGTANNLAVSSRGTVWNGATWDRTPGDSVNGVDVDITRVIPGTTSTSLGKAEDAAHVTGDTGVAIWAVRNDGAATSFTNATGDYSPIASDQTGSVHVVQKAQTASTSNVTASATSVTVLAANNNRKGAQIYNDSAAILYLKFGSTASTSSYTVPLAAGAYYELPAGYVGIVDGIWASATGAARITEET